MHIPLLYSALVMLLAYLFSGIQQSRWLALALLCICGLLSFVLFCQILFAQDMRDPLYDLLDMADMWLASLCAWWWFSSEHGLSAWHQLCCFAAGSLCSSDGTEVVPSILVALWGSLFRMAATAALVQMGWRSVKPFVTALLDGTKKTAQPPVRIVYTPPSEDATVEAPRRMTAPVGKNK
jgi:hypothetical protein